METLLIALGAGVAFIIAYHTYGRWLGGKVFNLAAGTVCPSERLRDDKDYVPTPKAVVFGHHFTSIAGTGPIVGPAIAVMWGWLPALLWVVLGSIFIGAVHDFGALVVSLRNNGQTVGDIAGRVLNRRVRLLFLSILFMALTIVLAIFGLVIANVFRMYPAAIFPCLIQIPIALVIGLWLHRRGVNLLIPSLIALVLMYVTVIYGDVGWLGSFNVELASWWTIVWVIVLLLYSYVASVLPVWTLLQPRDFINSLQLLTALALIVAGLCWAAFYGGAPPVEGGSRPVLEIAAPAVQWAPKDAPPIFPFLFITIACGAISGFHCLVSSGTSSKQIRKEPDARFVGFGSMLTEGFLATLVILACVAGLGLGMQQSDVLTIDATGTPHGSFESPVSTFVDIKGEQRIIGAIAQDWGIQVGSTLAAPGGFPKSRNDPPAAPDEKPVMEEETGLMLGVARSEDGRLIRDVALVGAAAWNTRYQSWTAAGSLGAKVGAFVDGAANFLKSMGIAGAVALALMGVLVASFAGTTLDTACRLQRYVVQELAATFLPALRPHTCAQCGYDLRENVSGKCPECGLAADESRRQWAQRKAEYAERLTANPITWLRNKHGATIFAIVIATLMAAMPVPGAEWTLKGAGKGGLILWPMFGATNQLLGGLSFLVISFYLWRRRKPIFFLALPLVFMLVMAAWAMLASLPQWLSADSPNWLLIVIAIATLLLEAWMIVEAILLWPRVRGVVERPLPGADALPAAEGG